MSYSLSYDTGIVSILVIKQQALLLFIVLIIWRNFFLPDVCCLSLNATVKLSNMEYIRHERPSYIIVWRAFLIQHPRTRYSL